MPDILTFDVRIFLRPLHTIATIRQLDVLIHVDMIGQVIYRSLSNWSDKTGK
jgi:hypothetical protein